MHAGDAFAIGERRQQTPAQRIAGTLGLGGFDVEALRQHEAALADAFAVGNAADRTRYAAKRCDRAPRPLGRRIEPLEIIPAAENFGVVGLVQVEIRRRARHGDKAPAAPKSGDAHALGHMLAVVPLIELVDGFGKQVVPDANRAQSGEAHGTTFRE